MEEFYRRDAGGSRLVFLAQDLTQSYVRNMVETVRIPSLLPMRKLRSDHGWEMEYTVTGMQPLSKVFERRRPDAAFLQGLLQALVSVEESCIRYLLPREHIWLDADHIFVKHVSSEVAFIYLPEHRCNWEQSMQELCASLAAHLPRTDDTAISLTYRLLEDCKEEGFSLADWLKNDQIKEETQSREADLEFLDLNEETPMKERNREMMAEEPEQKQKKKRRPFSFTKRREKRSEPSQDLQDPDLVWAKSTPAETTYLTNVGTEEEEGFDPKQLRILFPVNGGKEVVLDKDYMLVGKTSDYADIIIHDATVSRIHAELFVQKDGIYVEDCNSRNGTAIEGRILEPGERIRLLPGTHVRFGRMEYLFR